MNSTIPRRSFLKGGLAAACSVAASPLIASADNKSNGPQLATLLDIRKCVGCGSCVEACKETNKEKFPDPKKPFPEMFPARVKVEDWSDKRDVVDRLTPYTWTYIQSATVDIDGEEQTITLPRRCMHCIDPPCVKLCPWGAARQYKNGISRIDSSLCLGGAKCRAVCPWNIPQRQTGVGLYLDVLPSYAGNGVMYKCDRCYDRVAEGKLPACIEACPEGVQTIGPRDEIVKKAHDLAKEINGYIYGEKENGGTNTIYVSPVPFEKLNKSIETGKGRPHLKSVPKAMADAEKLTVAMAIAPFAGVAAVVGKLYQRTRSDR